MKIRLLPSQREFEQAPHQSLLEAALRASVPLNYGCHTGNCKKCLARVVAGEVVKVSHSDAVLSESERAQGDVLLCCYAAVTDAVLEVREAADTTEIPVQHMDLRLRKFEVLTPDIALLHLRTPRSNTLRFLAGQRARLGFNANLARELSIASCPCDGLNLQFHISAADTAVWTHLRQLTPNSTVALEGPYGRFVFDQHSTRAPVFIACGIGFAPIKSLLEHALSLELSQPVYLYRLTPQDPPYQHNYGRALMDALDNMHYTTLLSSEDSAEVLRCVEVIVNELRDPDRFDFYLAGPTTTTTTIQTALREFAVPATQLHSDIEQTI